MRIALLLLVAALTDGAKESRQSDTVCAEGYYQYDPIALRCEGGHGRKVVGLRAFPRTALVWRAPNGTRDLDLRVLLTPAQSGHCAAAMSARCEGMEKKLDLVGTAGSILNTTTRSAEAQGALWSWSGNTKPMENGSVAEWLQINGSSTCDLEVVLENQGDIAVSADITYSWAAVEPCPSLTKGCEPCPGSEEDGCQEDEMAFCNGSPYWECLPVAALMSSLTARAKDVQSPGNTGARLVAGSAVDKPPAEGNLSVVTDASEGLASLSSNASNASNASRAVNGSNASLSAAFVNASHTSRGDAAAEASADADTTPSTTSSIVEDSNATAADAAEVTDTEANVAEANTSKPNAAGAAALEHETTPKSAVEANATVKRSPSAGTKIWTAPDSAPPIPGLGILGSGNGTGFGLLPLGALPGAGSSATDETSPKQSSGGTDGGAAAGDTTGSNASTPGNSTEVDDATSSLGAMSESPSGNGSAGGGDENGTETTDAIEEDPGISSVASTSMDSADDNSTTTLPESNETTTIGPLPPDGAADLSEGGVSKNRSTEHSGINNSTSRKQTQSAANATAAHKITPADLGIFGGLGDPAVQNESLPFSFPGLDSSGAGAGKIGSTLAPAGLAQASTTTSPPLEPAGEAAGTTTVEPHGSSTADGADDAAGTSEPMISVIESAHNNKGENSEDSGGGNHKRPSVRGSSQKSEKQTMPIDLPSWQTAGAAVLVSICSMLFTVVFALFCLAAAARRLAAQSELDHKALRQRQMAEQRFDRLPTSEHGSRMGW